MKYFQMAMSDSNSELSSGLSNHKRSHSFNNHQSYTQHSQQSHKNKQKNQSARWLLNSCDSLDQSPAKSTKTPIGKKFSSVDFIDTTDSSFSNKGNFNPYYSKLFIILDHLLLIEQKRQFKVFARCLVRALKISRINVCDS